MVAGGDGGHKRDTRLVTAPLPLVENAEKDIEKGGNLSMNAQECVFYTIAGFMP